MNIGDNITFRACNGPTILTGEVIEVGITEVDGYPLPESDLPCVAVRTEDCGVWAVPLAWIEEVRTAEERWVSDNKSISDMVDAFARVSETTLQHYLKG